MKKERDKQISKWWILPFLCVLAVVVFVFVKVEKKEEIKKEQAADMEETDKIEETDKMEETLPTAGDNQMQNQEQAVTMGDIGAMEAGSIIDISAMNSEMINGLFYGDVVSDGILKRINGCSFQENDNISTSDLRYLRILHMGFDGQTHIGELIINKALEQDILEIMTELYENKYPIEKMVLIDEYGAVDESSMSDNNSSAFNYRVISGTTKLSKHSMGLAIDINPKYNPYVKIGKNGETIVEPANGVDYIERTVDFPYKIEKNDLIYKLFTEHGFTWGGDWNSVKDYQHFEIDIP